MTKKTFCWIFACLLTIVMYLSSDHAHADSITTQGKCGDNAVYTVDSEGVMRISGKGKVHKFIADAEVKKIIVEDGIEEIGQEGLAGFGAVTEIQLPSSVKKIGEWAFRTCKSLNKIVFSEGLEEMGKESSMHNVMKKAINEAAGVGKDLIYTETKGSYTIPSRAFNKSDIVKESTSSKHPGTTLTVRGETIGVREGYQTRKNGKRKGASVQVARGSGMKELKLMSGGRAYKAFLATMKSGHIGIFQRKPNEYMDKYKPIAGKSKGREAIKEIVSLSKSKAVEMAYEKQGIYTKLQEEVIFRMLKHMNAVIGGMG